MLMVLTVAFGALALGFAVYAWELARAERLRAAARVAALSAAIDDTEPATHGAAMFARDPRSVVQGRPLLKLAIGFGMAVLIIVLIAMTGERHASPAAEAAAAAQASQQALELLSMKHQRVGETLTVTGLVRNPGSVAQDTITAVVFAFDRDGSFIASGRAPLEFASIADGDESPFQVTIPGVANIGRYRVSFRTGAGVVRHVDRREGEHDAVSADATRGTPTSIS